MVAMSHACCGQLDSSVLHELKSFYPVFPPLHATNSADQNAASGTDYVLKIVPMFRDVLAPIHPFCFQQIPSRGLHQGMAFTDSRAVAMVIRK
jgi:hypothetical protein